LNLSSAVFTVQKPVENTEWETQMNPSKNPHNNDDGDNNKTELGIQDAAFAAQLKNYR